MLQRSTSFVSLTVVLLSLALASCGNLPVSDMPDISPKAERDYQRALASMKANKNKTAISRFKALTKKYPKLAGAHANLGMLYLKIRKHDLAESALRKATELNPQNPIAHNYLGIVYRQQGRFEDAKNAYKQALKVDKDYAFAHLNLGILNDLYLFDLQQAIKYYQSYQEMTGSKDKMVEKWIIDLKRRETAQNRQGGQKG